ncbi:ecdysone-induced protein 78C [Trichonephila clavipes]|nr:ecdysone-induced protein 78C [Trichonephila clavipes]
MYDTIVSIAQAHLAHCAYTQERTQRLVRKPALFGINDQQGAGVQKVWLVRAARLSGETGLTFADGTCVSRHHMELIFDREFVSLIFNFVDYFNNLRLSDSIIALYSAVVLVSAERDGICGHKALQQLQEQLLEALRQQVAEEHPAELHLFSSLVSKLPELRLLGHQHLEHLRWFQANWMHLRLSPFFAEVFDIPRQDSSRKDETIY